ncbi:MAG TPA: tetratricopeptide repeat protein [Verrucomicrobiae bacterium]
MRLASLILVLLFCAPQGEAASVHDPFAAGMTAYRSGDYAEAARRFREVVRAQPATGTLVNLGLAEWQQGRVGEAMIAWEQARWLDPFETRARNNLQFARTRAQLESPELAWYEIASTWLPPQWWPWIVGGSLWFVVGVLTLPAVLGWRKAPWQQALAALGLGVLLLSLPAHVGVLTRAQLGFVLEKDVTLRLTPTAEAEGVTQLTAGEPARRLRTRGNYIFIRTNHAAGWVQREEFALVCAW